MQTTRFSNHAEKWIADHHWLTKQSQIDERQLGSDETIDPSEPTDSAC
jgi:hypothetical protein